VTAIAGAPFELTDEEARVLGCLVEKSITTPDAYPLSANSIRLACNQTTNRDPITHYGDDVVEAALEGLRSKQLARRLKNPGERAIKHRHVVPEAWSVDSGELAVLTVLLLRGAQTPGELKQRTERLHGFASLDELESALARLAGREMVAQLERRPGQKESRWVQLATPTSERSIPADDEAPVIEPEVAIDATLDARDAATGTVLRNLAVDTEREVEAKLERARRAVPNWSARTARERHGTIDNALDRLTAAAEAIATIAARQIGGFADDLTVALLDSIDGARRGFGDPLSRSNPSVIAFVLDARATLEVDEIVSALVEGSAVLVKPAAGNVLAGLAIVDELHAAGVPVDVVQCVVGGGPTASALVHAGADRVRFVGGHEAGWRAARTAGERTVPIDLSLR
jgi:uncharacterized protein